MRLKRNKLKNSLILINVTYIASKCLNTYR